MNSNLHLNDLHWLSNNRMITYAPITNPKLIVSPCVQLIYELLPKNACDNFNVENTLNDIRLINHRKMKNDKEA